jgi:hypothetical protein
MTPPRCFECDEHPVKRAKSNERTNKVLGNRIVDGSLSLVLFAALRWALQRLTLGRPVPPRRERLARAGAATPAETADCGVSRGGRQPKAASRSWRW